MRNVLILLSSLAAAAASAAPYSAVAATASIDASYTMDIGVSLVSVTDREYYPGGFQPGVNYLSLDTGDFVSPTNANITYTGFTNADVPASGGRVRMTSTSTLRLDPDATTENTYGVVHLGHAAYLTSTNTSGGDAQIHFDAAWSGSYSASATRPSNPAGDFLWEYAGAQAISQVVQLDPDGDIDPSAGVYGGNVYDWSYNFGTGVVRSNLSDSFDGENETFSYTLKAGETKTYEIYSVVAPEVAYANPVPEPAALLPLGLGALAFLRRRRA